MKPYTRTTRAVRTIEEWGGGAGTSPTVEYQFVEGEFTDLWCPPSNPGNRKDATPWRFEHQVYTNFPGILYNGNPNNQGFSRVLGPEAISVGGALARPVGLAEIAYNKAVGKLGEQVRGSLDLSVDAFQSRQAAKMVREVGKLVKIWKSFRPTELPNRWLEYQYGWKPTVQSIFDLAKEASTPPKSGLLRFKARAAESETVTKFEAEGSSYVGGMTAVGNESRRCEIGIVIDLEPGVLTQLARISSLNPASIAYELMPWSFVIDWVVDIGGYIRMAENACLYSAMVKGGWLSVGERWDATFRREYRHKTLNQFADCSRRVVVTSFRRSALSSFPMPVRPRVNAHLGSERLLSAAALMSQFIKR